jgi:hypothetical protein
MSIGRVLYIALVAGSLFTCGVTLVTIWVLVRTRLSYWGAYVATKTGMLLVTGTILVVVLPEPIDVPPEPPSFAYIIGLYSFAVGLVFVCRDLLRRSALAEVPHFHDQPHTHQEPHEPDVQ